MSTETRDLIKAAFEVGGVLMPAGISFVETFVGLPVGPYAHFNVRTFRMLTALEGST